MAPDYKKSLFLLNVKSQQTLIHSSCRFLIQISYNNIETILLVLGHKQLKHVPVSNSMQNSFSKLFLLVSAATVNFYIRFNKDYKTDNAQA